MRRWIVFLLGFCFAAACPVARAQTGKALVVYSIDVEGGGGTLFVGPSGESVLIDTGNTGAGSDRDVGRIMDAVNDAGLKQIDYLITTHWDGDHWGGIAALASRIPIKTFVDHGPNVRPPDPKDAAATFLKDVYPGIYAKGKHMVAKPGDKLAIAGLDWRIVSSAGEVIKSPLPGAGAPNPYCADTKINPNDAGIENSMSVGSVITYGKFRMVHLGDLPQPKEFDLMCPVNRIGSADLWVVSHHGVPYSNSKVLVHAIHPRVIVMNNGIRKGGQPVIMKTIFSSPGLEDVYELHFSFLSGQEYTVPGVFIANLFDDPAPTMPVEPLDPQPSADPYPYPPPDPTPGVRLPPPPPHNGKAYWIKVSAYADGTFTVTNARNGFSKTYMPKTK